MDRARIGMRAEYLRADERHDTTEGDYPAYDDDTGLDSYIDGGNAAHDFHEPSIDDDFPESLEYDGLWGGSDWQDELTAQQEAEYERDFFGDDY